MFSFGVMHSRSDFFNLYIYRCGILQQDYQPNLIVRSTYILHTVNFILYVTVFRVLFRLYFCVFYPRHSNWLSNSSASSLIIKWIDLTSVKFLFVSYILDYRCYVQLPVLPLHLFPCVMTVMLDLTIDLIFIKFFIKFFLTRGKVFALCVFVFFFARYSIPFFPVNCFWRVLFLYSHKFAS